MVSEQYLAIRKCLYASEKLERRILGLSQEQVTGRIPALILPTVAGRIQLIFQRYYWS